MHGKRFVTRRCKWLGLTWRYWRWWLIKLLLKLLHTWHIWASNRYEAHSSDCKQTEHPQKEQNIELSPKKSCCCKLAFKYDFMHMKSIFIKEEFSWSCLKMHLHYTLFLWHLPLNNMGLCYMQSIFWSLIP